MNGMGVDGYGHGHGCWVLGGGVSIWLTIKIQYESKSYGRCVCVFDVNT